MWSAAVPSGAPGPAAGWGGVSWLLLAGCIAAWRRWLPLEAPPTEEEDVQVEDSLSLDLGGGCGGG